MIVRVSWIAKLYSCIIRLESESHEGSIFYIYELKFQFCLNHRANSSMAENRVVILCGQLKKPADK